MIKILKASAGSGKTYALSHRYIDLLMENEDEYSYKKILAVTFTNKATGEMKGRIIKDLFELSNDRGNPLSAKASRVLSNILHDYSAFAISTIDTFFQRTLRSFAKELGHNTSYQVELDKRSLTDEAVDLMLENLDPENPEDRKLVDFIMQGMEDRVSNEKSLDIDKELKEMAAQLKSEAFNVKSRELGINPVEAYSTLKLNELKERCRKFIVEFNQHVINASKKLVEASLSAGISPDDYNRKWFHWFEKYADSALNVRFEALTESFDSKARDTDLWFAKTKASMLPAACSAVGTGVSDFMAYWDKNFRYYNTAYIMLSNVYGLGVAARLFSIFDDLQKEKNLVCLDESNTYLKDIINGSDAPFVYEKVGVWIDHFLLDEFQDTSLTQWENFKPLLKESESRGNSNLIVGDVKQSIYRWRESDWSLLDSRVQEEFPRAVTEPMKKNFRSCEGIVGFNNDFYVKVAAKMDSERGTDGITRIYSDVEQIVGKSENMGRGYVQACFCEDEEEQLQSIVQAVRKIIADDGAPLGDIAVLVRKRDAGTKVAGALIDAGIPVVTEDSLYVKNSITVRRLVSLLSYVDNPDDKVNGYLAMQLNIEDIPHSYHNICGLCETLYNVLHEKGFREICEKETVYVTAFMDYMLDYSNRYGNNLREFLKTWQDAKPTISSALDKGSVKILTIHKSKGLDFPYVIVPFLEDIELYHSATRMWCVPRLQGTKLEDVGKKLFYVGVNAKSENTAFADTYETECFAQSVDAINMMYVATTRASLAMILMGTPNPKGNLSDFASYLKWYADQNGALCSVVDFRSEDSVPIQSSGSPASSVADVSTIDVYPLEYRYFPIGDRLTTRPYAADFFLEDESSFDGMSQRRKGVVLHDILSRVSFSADLEASVDRAVEDGTLPEASRNQVLEFLAGRIAEHPEFFPDSGCRLLCETDIIDSDGKDRRPDRVLVYPDGKAVVIDYKFGARDKRYGDQIRGYADMLGRMGYAPVQVCLWYVYDNVVE